MIHDFVFEPRIVSSTTKYFKIVNRLLSVFFFFFFFFFFKKAFHPEVLYKHNTSVSNTPFMFIYNGMCVRATCFDLVGHPQALLGNRSNSLVFLHCGIPNAGKLNNSWICFLGGPEDDLLGRNMSP